MNTITVPARADQPDTVQAFIGQMLSAVPCAPETQIQLQIIVEELFVNIAHYAYPQGVGTAVVGCKVDGCPPGVTIQFRDRGIPFNPLLREDADLTHPAEEHPPGGLGLLMVKQAADRIHYAYEDDQNILPLQKGL